MSTDASIEILKCEHLAILIADHRDQISEAFMGIARIVLAGAKTDSDLFLLDHLPDVLQSVARFLLSKGAQEDRDAVTAMAAQHARVRAASGGYSTGQIRKEYAIVRQQTLDLLKPSQELNKEAVNLYAECCELILSVTTEMFVRAEREIVK